MRGPTDGAVARSGFSASRRSDAGDSANCSKTPSASPLSEAHDLGVLVDAQVDVHLVEVGQLRVDVSGIASDGDVRSRGSTR